MRHSILHLVWIALLGITLGGCQDDDDIAEPTPSLFEEQQQTIEQFLQDQGITTQQTAAGLYYQAITENEDGTSPEAGNIIHLYYRIEQLDGALIAELDSSQNDPITFTFQYPGPNRFHVTLPTGLDEMVGTMREGEEYEFFLPSGAAYLDYEIPNVLPANAIVRARILVDKVLTVAEQRLVEDQKIKDYIAAESLTGFDSLASGVYYATNQAGDTSVQVTTSSTVGLRYTGLLLDGTVFDNNTEAGRELLEVAAGGQGAIEGFLTGIQQMSLGEKGTIIIPSHAAYGPGVVAIPQTIVKDLLEEGARFSTIPPFAILRFDVEAVTIN
ncbi:MAG: FKBP-type peptidyl-prolyl cis-trans isomerase [Tunicatimonas sp.]